MFVWQVEPALLSGSSTFFSLYKKKNQKEIEYPGNEVKVKQKAMLSLELGPLYLLHMFYFIHIHI